MRLSILCAAALLAVGSIGVASAAIVTDGSFANTSGGTLPPGYTAMQVGWNSHVLDSWTASGYTIQYNSIADAVGPWTNTPGSGACGYTQYHAPGNSLNPPNGSGGPCSTLGAVNGTLGPAGTGAAVTSFIAMDGLGGGLQGKVTQQLSGLMTGHTYTVSFYWGGTQEVQASVPNPSTDQYLTVGLTGSPSQSTNPISTPLGSFTGWNLATMTFTAQSADPTLSFLAFGMPENGPPMITLTGVSMTQNVPEPPELALFGIGLLGLGLLTVFARRRALRHEV